jgi:O-antigen biosynthesis protein WbqP
MYPKIKRVLDVVVAIFCLVLLSPLLLLLLLVIRIDSKGSPVFQQERVGRYGDSFLIYKLRTMKTTAPHDVATKDLLHAQSHITRVGHILRKTSMDELPQLFNILRGDMSLIGPRPLVPGEEAIHEERMKRGAYNVRPGITGWAQVNGRDCVDPETKAELDATYANNISLSLDLKIIILSVFAVLTARGVREGVTEFDDEIDERRVAAEKDKVQEAQEERVS